MSKLVHINDRRLFNGPTDEFMQLHPIKYHFLWNAYKKMSANHWTPLEIGLSLDIEQWRNPEKHGITPEDKQMVKYALGFFAVADSLVADNLHLSFYRQSSAPELRMFLLRQAYEEAVHTHAYQHIIESLEIDSREIFEMHLQIVEIYSKMKFASEQSSELHWQLFSYYGVLEGVFFYAMFAILQKMAHENKFPGVAKQFEYIIRDEAIHFTVGIKIFQEHLKEIGLKKYLMILDVFNEAEDCEFLFIDKAVTDPKFNLELKLYVEWIVNQRLEILGMENISKITKNPFPWIKEQVVIPKLENFFETTVTQYQVGGTLQW